MLDNGYTNKQVRSLAITNILFHLTPIIIYSLLGIIVMIDSNLYNTIISESVIYFNDLLVVGSIRMIILSVLIICYIILLSDNTTSIIVCIKVCYILGISFELINIAFVILKINYSISICKDFCINRFIYSLLFGVNILYISAYIKLFIKSGRIYTRLRTADTVLVED